MAHHQNSNSDNLCSFVPLSHIDNYLTRNIAAVKTILQAKPHANEIEHIKYIAHLGCTLLCNRIKDNNFSSAELKRLESLAVSLYLEEWLRCDTNCQQTIYSFASQKYILKNERSRSSKTAPESSSVKSLQRAEAIYRNMQSLQNKQAQHENSPFVPCPETSQAGKYYDFVTLRFFDLFSRGAYELYKLLVFRKKLMEVTSDKGSHRVLSMAYKEYNDIFNHLNQISNDREFVVACIQARKFESTFHFQLYAILSKHLIATNLSAQQALTLNAQYIWGRYTCTSIFRPSEQNQVITEHNDILDYDSQVNYGIGQKDISDHAFLWRQTLTNLLDFINLFKPPKEQSPWTDDDFASAALFFKESYPVSKASHSIKLTSDHYTRIQDICYALNNLSGATLKDFRTTMQSDARKRRSPHQK